MPALEHVQKLIWSLGGDRGWLAMNWALLYAEMKLPGEAWLEFEIIPHETGGTLKQTASFRPNGVWGRFYWYSLYPFHALIFSQLAKHIAKG